MDSERCSSMQVLDLMKAEDQPITYRQLDYWCRSGYVPGQEGEVGSGCQREFSAEQVEAVRRVAGIMRDIEMLKGELDSMRIRREPQRLPVHHGYQLRDLARTG